MNSINRNVAAGIDFLTLMQRDTEPWFKYEYMSVPIPAGLLTKWASSQHSDESGMTMPRRNAYIPRHFSIVPHGPRTPSSPSLVIDKPGLRLWHKTSVKGRPDALVCSINQSVYLIRYTGLVQLL